MGPTKISSLCTFTLSILHVANCILPGPLSISGNNLYAVYPLAPFLNHQKLSELGDVSEQSGGCRHCPLFR
jgi:hypothetical protein